MLLMERFAHRVHRDTAAVHSIMMEKFAQADEGGVGVYAHPLLLYLPPHTMLTVEVYAPAERADALLLFLLYPYMYSVDLHLQGGRDGKYNIYKIGEWR